MPSRDIGSKSDKYEMSDLRIPENGGFSPRFGARLQNASRYAVNSSPPSLSDSGKDFERQFSRILHKVYQTIEKNEMRISEQDRREAIRLEWQQVALVVDRLLLLLFLAILLSVTVGIMFQAPGSAEFLFGDPESRLASARKANSTPVAPTTEAPL